MAAAFNTFLLVFAAILPVVNPPGSALDFLRLTRGATPEIHRVLARRCQELVFRSRLLASLGRAEFYGISIPVLRVAGCFIVAVAGLKLLSEGSHKELEAS